MILFYFPNKIFHYSTRIIDISNFTKKKGTKLAKNLPTIIQCSDGESFVISNCGLREKKKLGVRKIKRVTQRREFRKLYCAVADLIPL